MSTVCDNRVCVFLQAWYPCSNSSSSNSRASPWFLSCSLTCRAWWEWTLEAKCPQVPSLCRSALFLICCAWFCVCMCFLGGGGQINISLRIYLCIYLFSCSILSELANLAAFGAYIVVKHCCIDLTDFTHVEGWLYSSSWTHLLPC